MRNFTKAALCCAFLFLINVNDLSAQLITQDPGPIDPAINEVYEKIPNDQIANLSIGEITLALVREQLVPMNDQNEIFNVISKDPEKLGVAVRQNEFPVGKLKTLFTTTDINTVNVLANEIMDQVYN